MVNIEYFGKYLQKKLTVTLRIKGIAHLKMFVRAGLAIGHFPGGPTWFVGRYISYFIFIFMSERPIKHVYRRPIAFSFVLLARQRWDLCASVMYWTKKSVKGLAHETCVYQQPIGYFLD